MVISPFIQTDFPTLEAYHGVHHIRKNKSPYNAWVVKDEGKPIGVLTAHDLMTRPYNLVIDCLTEKPVTYRNQKISAVLSLMKQSHSDVLMVMEGEELMGIICKNDIMDHLFTSVEENDNRVQSLAHDLKSPIANVLIIASMLEEVLEKEDNKELIMYARNSCEYAAEMIEDILLSEELGKGQFPVKQVDLKALVLDCVDFFKVMTKKKGMDIAVRLPDTFCTVEADELKLKRALHNIMSNSVKFSPEGGCIHVSLLLNHDTCVLQIRDEGIGIPEEIRPFVFEKFSRAKRNGINGENSTGLGMHIVKKIVELHDGKIWFETKESEGTAFFVQLKRLLT